MNRIFFFGLVLFFSFLGLSRSVLACENNQCGEAGKALWAKLQTGEITCGELNDQEYHQLGDFFFAEKMGTNHEVMDQMMEDVFGTNSSDRMHILMGKHFSNCEKGGEHMMGNWNNMMGWGGFGGLLMLLFWVLLVLALIALVKYIAGSNVKDRPPLDTLKERYAKGEIDKKEFEEKKKDLS